MARLVLAEGVQTHPSGYLVHERHLFNNVIVMCGAGHRVRAKSKLNLQWTDHAMTGSTRPQHLQPSMVCSLGQMGGLGAPYIQLPDLP